MKRKWSYFIGAAILAIYMALSGGAPLFAIAAGIGGAAVLLLLRTAKAK